MRVPNVRKACTEEGIIVTDTEQPFAVRLNLKPHTPSLDRNRQT